MGVAPAPVEWAAVGADHMVSPVTALERLQPPSGRCCRVWFPQEALRAGPALREALVGVGAANLKFLQQSYPNVLFNVVGKADVCAHRGGQLHAEAFFSDVAEGSSIQADLLDLAEAAIFLVADPLGLDDAAVQELYKGIVVENVDVAATTKKSTACRGATGDKEGNSHTGSETEPPSPVDMELAEEVKVEPDLEVAHDYVKSHDDNLLEREGAYAPAPDVAPASANQAFPNEDVVYPCALAAAVRKKMQQQQRQQLKQEVVQPVVPQPCREEPQVPQLCKPRGSVEAMFPHCDGLVSGPAGQRGVVFPQPASCAVVGEGPPVPELPPKSPALPVEDFAAKRREELQQIRPSSDLEAAAIALALAFSADSEPEAAAQDGGRATDAPQIKAVASAVPAESREPPPTPQTPAEELPTQQDQAVPADSILPSSPAQRPTAQTPRLQFTLRSANKPPAVTLPPSGSEARLSVARVLQKRVAAALRNDGHHESGAGAETIDLLDDVDLTNDAVATAASLAPQHDSLDEGSQAFVLAMSQLSHGFASPEDGAHVDFQASAEALAHAFSAHMDASASPSPPGVAEDGDCRQDRGRQLKRKVSWQEHAEAQAKENYKQFLNNDAAQRRHARLEAEKIAARAALQHRIWSEAAMSAAAWQQQHGAPTAPAQSSRKDPSKRFTTQAGDDEVERRLTALEQRKVSSIPPTGVLEARTPADWYGLRSSWELPPLPAGWAAMLTAGPGGRPCSLIASLKDKDKEVWRSPVVHPCVVFGASLKTAHLADLTDETVKSQHAALIFGKSGTFSLEPINGKVRFLSSRGDRLPDLVPGEGRRILDPSCCRFSLGRSRLVFRLELPATHPKGSLAPPRCSRAKGRSSSLSRGRGVRKSRSKSPRRTKKRLALADESPRRTKKRKRKCARVRSSSSSSSGASSPVPSPVLASPSRFQSLSPSSGAARDRSPPSRFSSPGSPSVGVKRRRRSRGRARGGSPPKRSASRSRGRGRASDERRRSRRRVAASRRLRSKSRTRSQSQGKSGGQSQGKSGGRRLARTRGNRSPAAAAARLARKRKAMRVANSGTEESSS